MVTPNALDKTAKKGGRWLLSGKVRDGHARMHGAATLESSGLLPASAGWSTIALRAVTCNCATFKHGDGCRTIYASSASRLHRHLSFSSASERLLRPLCRSRLPQWPSQHLRSEAVPFMPAAAENAGSIPRHLDPPCLRQWLPRQRLSKVVKLAVVKLALMQRRM